MEGRGRGRGLARGPQARGFRVYGGEFRLVLEQEARMLYAIWSGMSRWTTSRFDTPTTATSEVSPGYASRGTMSREYSEAPYVRRSAPSTSSFGTRRQERPGVLARSSTDAVETPPLQKNASIFRFSARQPTARRRG